MNIYSDIDGFHELYSASAYDDIRKLLEIESVEEFKEKHSGLFNRIDFQYDFIGNKAWDKERGDISDLISDTSFSSVTKNLAEQEHLKEIYQNCLDCVLMLDALMEDDRRRFLRYGEHFEMLIGESNQLTGGDAQIIKLFTSLLYLLRKADQNHDFSVKDYDMILSYVVRQYSMTRESLVDGYLLDSPLACAGYENVHTRKQLQVVGVLKNIDNITIKRVVQHTTWFGN